MPVLLLDLDNTLVDRAAAFASFAHDFVVAHGGGPEDVDWMITADGDGFRDRQAVAADVAARFGLADVSGLFGQLRGGLVDRMTLDPAVAEALTAARDSGWRLGIVTNGAEEQQTRKINHLGLPDLVDAWVISEAAGVRKPDPAIFHLAASRLGIPVDGGWMIGDSAEADIAGGQGVGLQTAWIRRGRAWTAGLPAPTLITESVVEAIVWASVGQAATLDGE